MRIGYVVLYVRDVEACVRFWTENLGMVEKFSMDAGDHRVVRVGFADQDSMFELVPLALMQDNPDGLDLATPSIAFTVNDLHATRAALDDKGVRTTEIAQHSGVSSFGFADNEDRWFAVTHS